MLSAMAHLIAECRIRGDRKNEIFSLSFDNGKYYNIIFNISARNVMLSYACGSGWHTSVAISYNHNLSTYKDSGP